MPNSIFLFDNLADAATLSASSTAGSGSMAVANVQDYQRTKFWRSGAGTSSYINMTLAAVRGVTHLALVDLNLSTIGTIRAQAWTDSLGGSASVLDTTVSPTLYIEDERTPQHWNQGKWGRGPWGVGAITQEQARNITIIPLGATITAAYWRVTFADTAGSYQQCGRIFLAKAFEFEQNLSYGWGAEPVDETVQRYSLGKQRYYNAIDRRLRLRGTFEWMTEDERTRMTKRVINWGQHRPLIYSIFPESTNRGLVTTVYGHFESAGITNLGYGQNALAFTVLEDN